jgi:peptidoglycan/xylan/chitin deacetylase (PgdA/CDA1 family)
VRLSELDVPVTIFIPTNPDLAELHTTVAMNTKNLVEKLKNAPNISFGSHGVTHRKWTRLSPDELARELEESHKTIGTWSGKPVTTCAYPKGSMNETVANAVRRHYIHAFLADGGPITAPIKDVMRIPRIGIFAHDSKSMFRMRTSPILRPLLSLRSQWKR